MFLIMFLRFPSMKAPDKISPVYHTSQMNLRLIYISNSISQIAPKGVLGVIGQQQMILKLEVNSYVSRVEIEK